MQTNHYQLRPGYLLTSLLVLAIGLILPNTAATAPNTGSNQCDQSTLTISQREKIESKRKSCALAGGSFKVNANCSYSCNTDDQKCTNTFIGETLYVTYSCKGVSPYIISGTGSTVGVMTLLQKFDNSVNSMNTQVIGLQRKTKGKSCPGCSRLFAQATRLRQRAKGKLSVGQARKLVLQMDKLSKRMQRQAKELSGPGTVQPQTVQKRGQTQKQKGAAITKPARPGVPMPTKPIRPGVPMAK